MSKEDESKALIPITLDNVLNPEKKMNLSDRPHLERLSSLVFIYMQAKARFDEQGKRWFQESQEQNTDLAKLLEAGEFQTLWPISKTQTGVDIPELMADKIHAIGNPFGFSPRATRAALEMAFILSSG